MPMLKADFHIHTSEDRQDLVFYSAIELIDMAYSLSYSVLSITNHDSVTYSRYLSDYAKERGILLIPGMEATIEGRHVLLYNLDFASVDRSSLSNLKRLKTAQSLVIAPHPYYPSLRALRGLLRPNISLFDAIEFCHFYTEHLDFNRSAQRISNEFELPMIGTSDAHQRRQFHTTYSLIDAEPHLESVIQSIKSGKVEIVTGPLPLSFLLKVNMRMLWRNQVIKKLGPTALT
jgi:hypothetical protein